MIEVETKEEICTLAQLRTDIALTRDFAFFQTGSEGPVPDSTQKVVNNALREENGPAMSGRKARGLLSQRAGRSLQALATLLNIPVEHVTWTQNTSTSIRLAAGSLGWRKGDKLAITGTEHISTRIMTRGIEQITGTKATVIPVGAGESYSPAWFLSQLDQHLTPDIRLLIISHASCIDGRRLPVREATRLAQKRGVKVLVDGAQAVGQFPVDVAEIDPEFYAGSVHKWLLGPAGIGYLVVAERQLPEYHPNLLPHPYPIEWNGNPRPLTASGQTHTGTETLSLPIGAGHVIETFQRIGLDQIEDRIRDLTCRLRDGLREMRGFRVLTPYPWELSSGITSLEFPGRSPEQVQALIDRIWDEYRTVVKFQVDFSGIRISVAPFNSEEEVDHLLEALERFVPAM